MTLQVLAVFQADYNLLLTSSPVISHHIQVHVPHFSGICQFTVPARFYLMESSSVFNKLFINEITLWGVSRYVQYSTSVLYHTKCSFCNKEVVEKLFLPQSCVSCKQVKCYLQGKDKQWLGFLIYWFKWHGFFYDSGFYLCMFVNYCSALHPWSVTGLKVQPFKNSAPVRQCARQWTVDGVECTLNPQD